MKTLPILFTLSATLAIPAALRLQDKGAAKPPPAAGKGATQSAPAGDKSTVKAAPAGEDPAMMEKMMKLAMPGDAHKELAKRAGTWEKHFKFRMSPDAAWTELDGKAEAKSILGGRYIQENVSFTMMGMPMEGMSLTGFDNLTQEYVSLWADTGSTWWVTASGKKAADGTIEFKGTMTDAAGSRPYRMVFRPKGDDEIETEMYDTIPPKGEVLVMTMTSKRKK